MGTTPPFPNDGSFLERFKQMQGSSGVVADPPTTSSTGAGAQPVIIPIKKSFPASKPSSLAAATLSGNGNGNGNGKLAFSLKAKSKLSAINPLKVADDNDEEEAEEEPVKEERQTKKQKFDAPSPAVPPPPADSDVRKVADKLATFVAKSGRDFEDITRQKNPMDSRFGFLFDVNCSDYKYYEHKLAEEEALLKAQNGSSAAQQPVQAAQRTSFQTPASALFENGEEARHEPEQEPGKQQAESDSLAMMEFYMKKAAQEDLRKPPKQTKDEMPPPAVLSPAAAITPQRRGHHMGDYIPQEELEKFMAKCNDTVAQKQVQEAAERAKIQADNIGHKLLSKMGWKEGEGLGSGREGRSDPIQAGQVKLNNLGLGAESPGEVKSEDDIYEQYKKRMMLGYRFRPNPLNNPRKAYY